jgi:phenylacetate-coenzyme A ligase PaaK-like adenylate-forming protein
MPLIRYIIDDSVVKNDAGTFDIVGHREREVLYGTHGEQVSVAAINVHDDTFSGVESYQFIQLQKGFCKLKVVFSEKYRDADNTDRIVKIQDRISDKLGNGFCVQVESATQLDLISSGKYKMLVQKYLESDC